MSCWPTGHGISTIFYMRNFHTGDQTHNFQTPPRGQSSTLSRTVCSAPADTRHPSKDGTHLHSTEELLSQGTSIRFLARRISSMEVSPVSIQHEKRVDRELGLSTCEAGEPMEVDSPVPAALSLADLDAFWLGHSEAQPPPQTNNDHDLAPVFRPEFYALSDEPLSVDSQTVGSLGVILTEWHTEEEEKLYFQDIHSILDIAFSAWETRVKSEGIDKVNAYSEYGVLNLPDRHDRSVIYGIRPDGMEFWKGYVRLCGQHTGLVKIDILTETIFGVQFGGIYNFETMGTAWFFVGTDRLVYYTDSEGSFEEDEDGFYVFQAHGPYELRSLRSRRIMDPFPPYGHLDVTASD